MSTGKVTTSDGAKIFYKDWGSGQPVVFSHGWPLTADSWDNQLWYVASNGFRAVAHDRRGHGRSSQSWDGNDMDTYADDLAAVIGQLDLRDIVLVGFSTGGGEVVRYLGRHGTDRVAKVVLVSDVTPHMLRTDTNPDGLPRSVFDEARAQLERDRAQYYRDFSAVFYGSNRRGSQVSQGLRDAFWSMCMTVGFKAAYDCVKAYSETDFTADCEQIDVPTLIIHGDDDQVVPIEISAYKSSRLIKDCTLEVYEGAPHGLTATHQDRFNADLLEFLRR